MHVVILASSAFIFQRFAGVWYSVFVKRSPFKKFAVKFYVGLSHHIFQHGSSLSLENFCDSWCMHQTEFSSVAVVPQSKLTELCSSAALVPQSKSTEMWSLAAPFDHDFWYFGTGQTNTLTLWYLLGKSYKPLSSHWNQQARPNYWKSYWREPHTHSTEGFDRVSAKFEFRCESL